ncbi:MAG: nitroreductase family protein [Deltaproteobacteria bacterium]|nr:nitroreductase family protein [Deltaproteobacteria bacterium]
MEYDNLIELIIRRRTIRRFKHEPIPDDYIGKVIEAARWAPSGANSQPWEFIIVKDEAMKKKIGLVVSETAELRTGGKIPVQSYFVEASVLIVVCGDPRLMEAYPTGDVREEIFTSSMAAAIQNMHLAATALGLEGSVWGTVGPMAGIRIKEMLNIPQVLKIRAIVPLGYPAVHPKPTFRREVDEISHKETYDLTKFRTGREIQEFINTRAMKGLNNFRLL